MPTDDKAIAYNANLRRLLVLLIGERQRVVDKVGDPDPVCLGRQVQELNGMIDAVKAAIAPYTGPVNIKMQGR